MKLYNVEVLLRCSAMIAAGSEAEALAEVAEWERAWVDTGEIVGVADDPEVVDVEEIEDMSCVRDLAHVAVNKEITEQNLHHDQCPSVSISGLKKDPTQ
jgi:hypothetical protein